jgi:hypothetical protein
MGLLPLRRKCALRILSPIKITVLGRAGTRSSECHGSRGKQRTDMTHNINYVLNVYYGNFANGNCCEKLRVGVWAVSGNWPESVVASRTPIKRSHLQDDAYTRQVQNQRLNWSLGLGLIHFLTEQLVQVGAIAHCRMAKSVMTSSKGRNYVVLEVAETLNLLKKFGEAEHPQRKFPLTSVASSGRLR